MLLTSIIFFIENSGDSILFSVGDISMTGNEITESLNGKNPLNLMRGFVECQKNENKPSRIFLPPIDMVNIMQ